MPHGLGPFGWVIDSYYLGYWYWRCRRFPWLPRWWWTGIYGPITPFSYWPIQPSREEEIAILENEAKFLEQQLEFIRKRLEELRK
ncbi:MAG: DUF5320 domain-containing protein [Nitrososphaeria archaeon]